MMPFKIFAGIIAVFVYLPLGIYGSWLLYQHVHATDLMWFIWWLLIPFNIVLTVIVEITKVVAKK